VATFSYFRLFPERTNIKQYFLLKRVFMIMFLPEV
jgi:hypothetical protein